MNFHLEPIRHHEEKELFFAPTIESTDMGCIGFLRGDFGRGGREFYTTWFPQENEHLKDENFRVLFDALVNTLRENGEVLSDRPSMNEFCRSHPECRITEPPDTLWGFRIATDNHVFYLRCDPKTAGVYNFYCFCYDRGMLTNYLLNEEGVSCFDHTEVSDSKPNTTREQGESVYVFTNTGHLSPKKLVERHMRIMAHLESHGYELGGSLSISSPMHDCYNEVEHMVEYCRARDINKIIVYSARDIAAYASDVRMVTNWLAGHGLSVEIADAPIQPAREMTPDYDSDEPSMEM